MVGQDCDGGQHEGGALRWQKHKLWKTEDGQLTGVKAGRLIGSQVSTVTALVAAAMVAGSRPGDKDSDQCGEAFFNKICQFSS